MSLSSILTLIIGGILINNVVLTKFLGMCPFMGVSTKLSSAIGMGLAVTFVIFGSSVLSWLLYYYVLDPLNIEYMELITFILLIAAFIGCGPLVRNLYHKYVYVKKPTMVYLSILVYVALFAFCIAGMVSSTFSSFPYAQF